MSLPRDRLGDALLALSDRRQRWVLLRLAEIPSQEDGVEEAELCESVRQDDEDRTDVELSLRHDHFPSLETLGIIVWDRDAGTVYRGPNWETADSVVGVLNEHCDALEAPVVE